MILPEIVCKCICSYITTCRRKGVALMFRVVQRALLRTAFLLVAFQVRATD